MFTQTEPLAEVMYIIHVYLFYSFVLVPGILTSAYLLSEYRDLERLYTGLSNSEVDGILLDVFTANYISNKQAKYSSDALEQVRILEFPFPIGIYMVNLLEEGYLFLHHCIKTESDNKFELDIYPTVLKYIRGSTFQVGICFRLHFIIYIARISGNKRCK